MFISEKTWQLDCAQQPLLYVCLSQHHTAIQANSGTIHMAPSSTCQKRDQPSDIFSCNDALIRNRPGQAGFSQLSAEIAYDNRAGS
jgi:hypothetical protein